MSVNGYDWLVFDTVPGNITPQQVGPNYDRAVARKEAAVYMRMLQRMFPPPGGCYFKIVDNPHDFGSYLSVNAMFPTESEKGIDWAYNIEANLPEDWDEQALSELGPDYNKK